MHTHTRAVALAAVLALPAALLGCQQNQRDKEPVRYDASPHVNAVRQAERDWAWISGTRWNAAQIEGKAPIPDTALWIRFEDHTWMSGSAGCNRLTAGYSRRGIDGLKVSQIAATRMLCNQPEGVMQQEARFLHLLSSADAYHAEPDNLELITDGVVVLRFTRADED
jgi:heat shock protein HslJ